MFLKIVHYICQQAIPHLYDFNITGFSDLQITVFFPFEIQIKNIHEIAESQSSNTYTFRSLK
jgi:hypothetical protein